MLWNDGTNNEINCQNLCLVCSLPQSQLYVDPPLNYGSVPPCLTRKDTECAAREFSKIYHSQDRDSITGCKIACKRTQFRWQIEILSCVSCVIAIFCLANDQHRVSARDEVSVWDGESNGYNSLATASLFYKSSRIIQSIETPLHDLKWVADKQICQIMSIFSLEANWLLIWSQFLLM